MIKREFDGGRIVLYNGDCKEVMAQLGHNLVDSIVSDPPYGLSFMGKKWDYDVPSQEIWENALKVLKHGGYLLAFAGTRTQHRMAVRIEDAGFEIRDMIAWVYGSGFPKSLNIALAIDKLGNIEGVKVREEIKELIIQSGKTDKELSEVCSVSPALIRLWRLDERTIQKEEAEKLKYILGNLIPQEKEREVIGLQKNVMSGWNMDGTTQFKDRDITKGTSEYEGWGTALKPALEPITVARKPLSEKTVAENVLKWGTGGINIDGSRVESSEIITNHSRSSESAISKGKYGDSTAQDTHQTQGQQQGRFPANFIHDGSDEVVELFPNTKSGGGKTTRKNKDAMFDFGQGYSREEISDSGSASRFFYCAKASKSERNAGCEGLEEKEGIRTNAPRENEDVKTPTRTNNHPTVKPIALMEYLIKLITPKGKIVLDPFMGSGSTGIAAIKTGNRFIGIELDEDYFNIACARIEEELRQPNLF